MVNVKSRQTTNINNKNAQHLHAFVWRVKYLKERRVSGSEGKKKQNARNH